MNEREKQIQHTFERLKNASRAAAQLNAEAKKRKDEREQRKAEVAAEAKAPKKRRRRGEFGGPDVSSKATVLDVEKAFREATMERLGFRALISAWDGVERSLARKLLDAYGDELTFKAIALFFERWEEFSFAKHDRLDEVPTLRRLWWVREKVFTAVQVLEREQSGERPTRMQTPPAPRRGKDSDEYRPMRPASTEAAPAKEPSGARSTTPRERNDQAWAALLGPERAERTRRSLEVLEARTEPGDEAPLNERSLWNSPVETGLRPRAVDSE